MNETWLDIPEYEGLYQVSNIGRVRSLDRVVSCNGGLKTIKGKILKNKERSGYYYVSLSKDGIVKNKSVHRLVAVAFIPKSSDELNTVNHKDENRKNNHVDNLEWCTQDYNYEYSYNLHEEERKRHMNKMLEKAKKKASKKIIVTTNSNQKMEFNSIKECADHLKVSSSYISNMLAKRRTHKDGYLFEYK